MSDSLHYSSSLNAKMSPQKKGGMQLVMALVVSAFYSAFVILCVVFPKALAYEVFPSIPLSLVMGPSVILVAISVAILNLKAKAERSVVGKEVQHAL